MGLTETAASQSKTWAYAYDALDRLQTAARDDGAHYGYTLDVADNIQSITDPEGTWTYTHDNANKFDQAPYRYDALGNLIEDEAHTYQWDMENRLTGIGYKTEPQRYSEFRYDGQGRRIAAIETSGTSQTETRYTWCGRDLPDKRRQRQTDKLLLRRRQLPPDWNLGDSRRKALLRQRSPGLGA